VTSRRPVEVGRWRALRPFGLGRPARVRSGCDGRACCSRSTSRRAARPASRAQAPVGHQMQQRVQLRIGDAACQQNPGLLRCPDHHRPRTATGGPPTPNAVVGPQPRPQPDRRRGGMRCRVERDQPFGERVVEGLTSVPRSAHRSPDGPPPRSATPHRPDGRGVRHAMATSIAADVVTSACPGVCFQRAEPGVPARDCGRRNGVGST